MNCQQAQQVQGNAVGHSLQQRTSRAVDVVTQALVKNEAGKNQRICPGKERDCSEAQVSQHNQREHFESPELTFVREDEPCQMKQSERDQIFSSQQTPGLIVERSARHAGQGQGPES